MSTLTHVFSSVLGVPEESITPETSPQNTPAWDSLNAIILITEIEHALDLRFEYAEAMEVKNFADVLKLVASKGKDAYA